MTCPTNRFGPDSIGLAESWPDQVLLQSWPLGGFFPLYEMNFLAA